VVGVTPLALDAGRDECANCGAYVTDRFVRVFGLDGTAHRCPECDTWVRIEEGSAAGASVSTPDPETSPGRHGGEPA
jgi:hypothetical protein